MSRRTAPMLLTPTLDECKAEALKQGMPEREGEKLFIHYEMVHWRYGKAQVPISSLSMAVAGWKHRWQEKGCPDTNGHAQNDRALLPAKRDELNRVLERIRVITQTDSHSDMRQSDKDEYRRLRARRDELRKELGVQY